MNIGRWESYIEKYRYLLCFIALGLVYFLNMFPDVMEVDAAQYAAIAMEMTGSGNYLEIFQRGEDYLDKPPLLFWLSSLSFSLFGVSNFTYKLPAVLVIILGIYSTYRFTLHWYDLQRARAAAIVLACTQALLLITNDVRTDGILMGFTIFSVWQLSVFLDGARLKHLVAGAAGVAFAMMAKGPLGLIVVIFAVGGHLLITRNFRAIFNPKWILLVFVTAVLLIPMCWGLYHQFDLHPEKEVYGLKGPSGLKFFFWTQSFGRITGDIYWNNNTGYFYFFHTILWDYQPWILFLVPALLRAVKIFVLDITGRSVRKLPEYFTLCGFLLGFAALSASSYKLPHYIFPLFPFASVITADFIVWLCRENHQRLIIRAYSVLSKVHFGLMNLFFVIPIVAFVLFFPLESYWLPVVLVILFLLFWYLFVSLPGREDKILIPTLISMVAFGLVLSTYFYPSLLKYQSESSAGRDAALLPANRFYFYRAYGNSLDFYAGRIVPEFDLQNTGTYEKGTQVFTDEEGKKELEEKLPGGFKVLKVYEDYHVSGLKITFLNRNTRYKTLKQHFLLEKQ